MDCNPGPSKRVKYGDKNYDQILTQWADEIESDASDIDSDSDFIPSAHESESEIEAEEVDQGNHEEDDVGETSTSTAFYGKNRFKWSSIPAVPKHTRTLQHNIVLKCPGLKNINVHSANPEQVWNLLFNERILNIILQYTNARLMKIKQKYKNTSNSADIRELDLTELKAFLGLLIFTSIFKSNHEDIRSLFATDGSGRDIFRCVMNSNRFAVILSSLRFDDAESREERKRQDPLAAISEIFDTFISNCQEFYSIGSCACVDEMLVSFRGRCRFKMYMPMKPSKYGIKVMALTDARTGYLLNAYVYSGKDSDGHFLSNDEKVFSKPTQAVVKLAKPIYNTNRNITADNWFSSLELVNFLKTKKLTYVGTLKKKKK